MYHKLAQTKNHITRKMGRMGPIFRCVKTQVVVAVTLTQISLYIRVDKENSLESLLNCVHYLYMSDYLSLFTNMTILHN